MKTIELDTKILNKNLEITRISKQLDDLTSDYVALKEQIDKTYPYGSHIPEINDFLYISDGKKLTKEINEHNHKIGLYKQREQTPMHMIHTLERCYDFIKLVKKLSLQDDVKGHLQVKSSGLTQDLRNVIKFLED